MYSPSNAMYAPMQNGGYSPQPPRSPLTKQVNEVFYEMPKNKYASPWSHAPEFLKIMSDQKAPIGGSVVFDCCLFGTPRPKVFWLFNEQKIQFSDMEVVDTCDVCQLKIKYVRPYHYGIYTVVAENEIGRATAAAALYSL